MAQQNQAGQSGAGEVFVEMAEKKQHPNFWFSRRGENGAWQRQMIEEVRKTSTSEDQRLATCDRLPGNLEPKWILA